MHKILILVLLLSSFELFAQPGVAPQEEVNGVMCYVHTVESGNTLWGLQTMYGVKVEEIMKSNPKLSEGLQIGQQVVIPIPNYVKPLPVTSEYKVKKKETLYGLSRKFNTSVDELIQLNPELSNGLKKGQIIKVPGKIEDTVETTDPVVDPVIDPVVEPKRTPNPFTVESEEGGQNTVEVSFSDSTIRHSVAANETMYSIARRFMVSIETLMKVNNLNTTKVKKDQVLIIPVKSERIVKVPIKVVPTGYDEENTDPIVFEEKPRYKIAVLLPFHLDYGPGYSKHVSGLATQYYMGANLAIDSLKKMGLNADVFFFDSKNDTVAVLELLNSAKFENVDLVIGPFFPSTQNVVAKYCRENFIRMVCPVASKTKILEKNKLVYASVPSSLTLMKGMAEYVLRTHAHDNIILVKPTKEEDLLMYEAFRKAFNESPVLGVSRPSLRETTIDGMKSFISTKTKNIIIMPTNTKNTAVKFMNSLNRSSFRARPDQIYVFGTKEWVDFTDINNLYKNKFNFHFASPNFIDYYTDEMITMNRAYRKEYNTDMSKMAVQGYDVMMYYCASFFLEVEGLNLMMNNFNMTSVSPVDGFENTNVYMIEQEEYELMDSENFFDD